MNNADWRRRLQGITFGDLTWQELAKRRRDAGIPIRTIAHLMGRSPSEIARATDDAQYQKHLAYKRAWYRRKKK
jgi:IS30 family transposase